MIAVTGATGYVGGRILRHLRAAGIDTIALVRDPPPGDEWARRYALGTPVESSLLDGVELVVHAAYDLSQDGAGIRAVNFVGSLPLLDALAARGGRAVLISSLSAFVGARSKYGRTKLELEQAVLALGGIVLRPGLVFGARAGGLFGAVVAAVSKRAIVPLVGGGSQRLFVTHDQQLCELIATIIAGRTQLDRPLFAAHEAPTTLRAITAQVASVHGRPLAVVPIPARLVEIGLRSAELAGVGVPFRSDGVRALLNPIPLDQVSALARSSVEFPPLTPELWVDR